MALELKKHEEEEIITSIKKYFEEEFEQEIGDLKAKLLLNYFIKEIGPYAYNNGVMDAERYFRMKLEDLRGSCYEFPLTYWIKKK